MLKRIVRYVIRQFYEEQTCSAHFENINTVRWRKAIHESVDFIESSAPTAIVTNTKEEIMNYALEKICKKGLILEFGVFQGKSIRHISEHLLRSKDDRMVHGFDSFQGLQEDWLGHRWAKGAFSTAGKLPKVGANVQLHEGWIDTTLPKFLAKNGSEVSFVHIDTDTYTPAHLVLSLLKDRLTEDSMVLFDDYLGYPNWKMNEHRALREVLNEKDYTFLGFSNQQALIRINRTFGH